MEINMKIEKIKMDKIRIKNLVNLMKVIKILEDSKICWKDSIHDDTIVYCVRDWVCGLYSGLLIVTGGQFIFVRRERVDGIWEYTDQLRIEDRSDWGEHKFDPSNGSYGLYRNCDNVFSGTFMDACGYVLDFWMSRDY